MDALVTGVCDAFLLVLFEHMRPEAHRSQPWTDRQMRKLRGGVAEVARTVGDQPYAVGGTFGIADISAGSTLGYLDLRFPELGWRETHPGLARYMDGLAARPSFQTTTPYPQSITSAVV